MTASIVRNSAEMHLARSLPPGPGHHGPGDPDRPLRRFRLDEGAEAAWLIAQHSPDQQFMAECLERLRAAVEAADASPANLAYLEDRVRMLRAEPQLYGTQFIEKDGTYEPWPIEDPDGLDERRAAICLGSFADYERQIRTLR
jgi:hypothetical protein